MSTMEFQIVIDEEGVHGWYQEGAEQPVKQGEGAVSRDAVVLDTIQFLIRLLGLWDLIEDVAADIAKKRGQRKRRIDSLLEPRALRVLGAHLWRLILANEVGEHLARRIPAEGEPPLRLSIEFDDLADPLLRGLPWEFLYDADHKWFLATKTELLLTRYVKRESGRARVAEASEREPLRALLIAALPGDKEFAPQREALTKLRTALRDITHLHVPEPILSWNQARISAELKADQYHIVHVVGVCRGDPGKPEILLGGGDEGFHDPAQFVDCLTAGLPQPRLIILQLCDREDGDASENFERMAPDLIKRGVPAVLALQYAAKVEDQPDRVGLGKQFYASLVDGQWIGKAVQETRRRLQEPKLDRRFGTPVLYLQEDGALLRPTPRSDSEDSLVRRDVSAARSVKEELIKVCTKHLRDQDLQRCLRWVASIDPGLGVAEVREQVQAELLDTVDPILRTVFAEMFATLVEWERHHGQH